MFQESFLAEATPKLSFKHVQAQGLRQFQIQTPPPGVSGASPGQCQEQGGDSVILSLPEPAVAPGRRGPWPEILQLPG